MDVHKLESLPPPPGVIGALRAGFDVVASHVMLILLPLTLDLFLWLGPRLSVRNLNSSILSQWFDLNKQAGFPVRNVDAIMEQVNMLGRVNFLNWIRTLPIGIPSLLSGIVPATLPLKTPLGVQNVIQIPSILVMLGCLLALTLVGWVGGGLYFRWVSGTVLGGQDPGISPVRAILQTFLLSIIWTVMLIAISIPVLILLAVFTLINPALASGAAFLLLVFSFWFIVPLYFTPHGIFIRKQNAFSSIYTSLRMARFTLPTSAMFVFSVFILSTGLNYLWSVPPTDSWMLVIGIAGHAFITTALLAASFVYYRDMNAWLQLVFENLRPKNNAPARQV